MNIAIDFDGTIVEHKYPQIGKERLFAFETMKQLQKQGHNLMLWTFRSDKELEEAISFCKERGVEFYTINNSYPDEEFQSNSSRKILADIYIDDRNLGGFPGWSLVWQLLGNGNLENYMTTIEKMGFSATFWDKVKKLFNMT